MEQKEKLEQAKEKAKEFYRKAKEPNPITRTAKSIGDATVAGMKRNPWDTLCLTVLTGCAVGVNGSVDSLAEADGFFMVADDLGDI